MQSLGKYVQRSALFMRAAKPQSLTPVAMRFYGDEGSCPNAYMYAIKARVQHPAPRFEAMSWHTDQFKKVSLDDYKGKYVVLFFYPLDFTFVCPTEIVEFNEKSDEFKKNGMYTLYSAYIFIYKCVNPNLSELYKFSIFY